MTEGATTGGAVPAPDAATPGQAGPAPFTGKAEPEQDALPQGGAARDGNPRARGGRVWGGRVWGGRFWSGALVLGALALVLGANAHLLVVAVASQPDCVAHVKSTGQGGGYGAAKSSC